MDLWIFTFISTGIKTKILIYKISFWNEIYMPLVDFRPLALDCF